MSFKNLLYVLLTFVALTSCSESAEEKEKLVAVGGKQYGGEFRFMSTEKVNSLFPAAAEDLYAIRIISQIYEPLLRFDSESMRVVPNIAESFTVSDDQMVYTFKIRSGIVFHKDECFGGKTHPLEAADVKYTLDYACSGQPLNQMSYLLLDRIQGAKTFYSQSKSSLPANGVSGIKVVDKNTVKITLTKPFAGFEKIMSHPGLGIFPKEAISKYGKTIGDHPVGTGPFTLESKSADKIVLKRHDAYWQKDEFGNKLPFLDKVVMTYSKNKRSELMAFRSAQIDAVLEIPVEEVENVLGKLEEADKNIRHKVETSMSFSTNYIAMNMENELFSDLKVRKALNLAFDRNVLVDQYLEGEGYASKHGFVPELPEYPFDKVAGHDFDPDKAKSLLAQAGFPNGRGFPNLEIYVNAQEGSAVHKMCLGFVEQVNANLNINLSIVLCSLDERKEAINSGKALMWRAGWVADYPEAENFLALFYSDNIGSTSNLVNAFRYSNATYDDLYRKAVAENDEAKRMQLYTTLDQMIIDDAAVIPILTDDHMVMYNARIKDLKASPMEMMYLNKVYIKEAKKQ